ncbi:hypothetical protein SUDANB176_07851 (plasmid) [Streptomyces sp. enrichment culture]
MGKHTRPKSVRWKRVLRSIRLWMAPVAATVFWVGQMVRTWWWHQN